MDAIERRAKPELPAYLGLLLRRAGGCYRQSAGIHRDRGSPGTLVPWSSCEQVATGKTATLSCTSPQKRMTTGKENEDRGREHGSKASGKASLLFNRTVPGGGVVSSQYECFAECLASNSASNSEPHPTRKLSAQGFR